MGTLRLSLVSTWRGGKNLTVNDISGFGATFFLFDFALRDQTFPLSDPRTGTLISKGLNVDFYLTLLPSHLCNLLKFIQTGRAIITVEGKRSDQSDQSLTPVTKMKDGIFIAR